MTPFLLALLAAAPAPAAPPLPTTRSCIDLVRAAPDRAVAVADGWRAKGGGLDAMQCGALALSALERWSEAGVAFEATALEATRVQDLRAADYWVQAGNAWLAGGDPAKAKKDFDTALASTTLAPKLRGEAHLDRARAAVAAGDAAAARSDIDQALTLVSADPFAWYLSAALARRIQLGGRSNGRCGAGGAWMAGAPSSARDPARSASPLAPPSSRSRSASCSA